MQPEEWSKIKSIFNQMLDLSEDEREKFLADYEDNVHFEVGELLKSHQKAQDFIDKPALISLGLIDDILIGKEINGYKIIEQIGVGGMGTVYLAEKLNSDFKQKVALKIIKRGMDSETILKRFATERKILSRLKHPNIAELLDGGISSEGQPFFVMEFVDGKPLKEFCRENSLELEKRLEIFQQICSAVEYAHRNLIIHRDLKPSNILVTNDGIPKLLDFGIAKLLSDEETEITITQNKMFTPEYASPEQLIGKPVTTSTDVYSLGVILYELLSGRRPFEIKGKSYDEIIKDVCEKEPTAPSRVNAERGMRNAEWKEETGNSLQKNDLQNTKVSGEITTSHFAFRIPYLLQGDLDNIILKALRKEPLERYDSVQRFSEDILRYLKGLPVLARPQTLKYRFEKYVKRHKVGVLAAALVLISLIGGISVATWQAIVAQRERARAERQFAETRKIANSLLFEIHDTLSDLPGATASRELLVKRALEYLNTLSSEAGDNPELLLELSIAYRKVGDIQGDPFMANTGNISEANESYKKSFELQEKLISKSPNDLNLHKEILITLRQLGDNYYGQGKTSEAEKSYQRAVEAATYLNEKEPQNLATINNLAFLYLRLSWAVANSPNISDKQKYFGLAQKYSDHSLALNPEDQYGLVIAIEIYSNIGNNLGNPNYNDQGKPEEALPYLQKSLELRQKKADHNPESNNNQSLLGSGFRDLADILLAQGKVKEAIENYEKALNIHRNLAEKDNKDRLSQGIVGFDLAKLGNAFLQNGDTEKSLANHKESVEILEKLNLIDNANIMVAHTLAIALEGLADALTAKKEFTRAISIYKRSLEIEEDLISKEENWEFKLIIAKLNLKIGRTKLLTLTQQKLRATECLEIRKAFQKSIEIYTQVQNENFLSPSNLSLMQQSQKELANLNCQ